MALFTICFAFFFFVGILGVRGARLLAIRFGWMDHPKGRSFHDQPMPRIGGLGVLLPVLVAVGAISIYAPLGFGATFIPGILLPALFIAGLSFIEDCVELSRKIRFSAHLLAGVWVVWFFRDSLSGGGLPLIGSIIEAPWLGLLLVIWIAGLTNAYNFMDGIDGIAAIQAIVALFGWFVLLSLDGSFQYANGLAELLILVALMAGLVAFLTMNWSPAVIFLGDNGSTFLGFFLAVLPIYATSAGILPLAVALEAGVLFLWPFIFDPALAFARRLLRREPVFEAHRTHVYQLMAASFQQRSRGHQVTTLFFGLLSLMGLGLYWLPWPFWTKLLLLLGIWAVVLLLIRRGGPVGIEARGYSAESPRQAAQFRIFLSPPEISEVEARRITEAFRSGFIAPVGPQVNAFERALSDYLSLPGIQALNSGTAAIHLGLRALGVGPGDCVLCPDLTFIASVNPVRYLGAEPVLVDVDPENWAMDVELAREAIRSLRSRGRRVKAMVVVHAYGLPAPMEALMELAREEEVLVLEDCAGAFGARIGSLSVGAFGDAAAFSFNGNKVLTTSGGGALYLKDPALRARTLSWANQGKKGDAIGYEHVALGYNYKLSNICAAIGLGQLETLQSRLDRKTFNYSRYRELLRNVEGVRFLPEPAYGKGNYWLSCVGLSDSAKVPLILTTLRNRGIEASPIWKPMHQQTCNEGMSVFGGVRSSEIFATYLSLPSGSSLTKAQIEEVCACFRSIA
jgi:dTDP-4-amino-4,6-dideoxygalactose transaminase/UDP-N-acetylmuramyl pentapeptide phosphotransferase/UDP-N-acetylglucosamine-1-phosphate transferase